MRNRIVAKTNFKGTTLLETLFAMMLLMFMIVFLSGMVIQATKIEQQESSLTIATFIAEDYLEEIKKKITTVDEYNNLVSRGYAICTDYDRYIYNVDVSDMTTSVKYVGITIYYRDYKKSPPEPDTKKMNAGRILKMGTYILRP